MRSPVRTGKEDLQLAAAISFRQAPESRGVLALIGLRQFEIRMVVAVFLHTINTFDNQ
jgi:lipid A disaccharide synthetase